MTMSGVPSAKPVDDISGVGEVSPEHLARFVRTERERRGWTQDALAGLSGLEVRTIQRVEGGERSNLHTRRALAVAFGFANVDQFNQPPPYVSVAEFRGLQRKLAENEAERSALEQHFAQLKADSEQTRLALGLAAARDIRWLELVRSTLMPPQAGRIPFHNDIEVSLRGYHCTMRNRPRLDHVTWAPLPYMENGLHRGYRAGLIFTGHGFAPGIMWTMRGGSADDGTSPLTWRFPNIYQATRFEVSTCEDPDDTPASFRGFEFAVRHPDGQISDWIPFSFPFDDDRLAAIVHDCVAESCRHAALGEHAAAVECLRKAMVISRGLRASPSIDTAAIHDGWRAAIERMARARIRFSVGARVRIRSGEAAGLSGTVVAVHIHCVNCYEITLNDDRVIPAADEHIEADDAA